MDSACSNNNRELDIAQRMQSLIDQASSNGEAIDSAAIEFAECILLLRGLWPQEVDQSSEHGIENGDRQSAEHKRVDAQAVPLPKRLGRFEIRRLLGHGGFGIVLLAYDETLDREVALKIPRPELLLARDMRSRFLREGKAAALLDHPSIVPVYDAGELGTIWYIAAAYVKGPSLAKWLLDNPIRLSAKTAASIVIALADAVHHAHSRGILHRDLKPSNVLLEPQAESLRSDFSFVPKLTDFGLAKWLEAGDDESLAGVLLGTPRYMAPEQAACDFRNVGVQTDVYGLGTILFELLTGGPPSTSSKNEDTLQHVQRQTSPCNILRTCNVPRDLETICLKCLETSPSRRYESAKELADDLGRFLNGEVVLARPMRIVGRFSRWCRRRPMVASLAISLVVAIMVGLAGAGWQWLRAEQNLVEAETHAKTAEKNLKQAEKTLLDLAWIVEESSLWSAEGDSFRAGIHDKLKQYDDEVNERDMPGQTTAIRAAIYSFAARSAAVAGDFPAAEESYRRGLEAWQSVVTANPDSTDYRRALSLCLFHYALFYRDQDAKGEEPLGRVSKLMDSFAENEPSGGRTLADFANLLFERGNASYNARRSEEARDAHQLALIAAEALLARFPGDSTYVFLTARLSKVFANDQRRKGGSADRAAQDIGRARQLMEQLVAQEPSNRVFREELAEIYRLVGFLARDPKKASPVALESFKSSVTLYEQLLEESPTRALKILMAKSLRDLATAQLALLQEIDGFNSLRRCHDILRDAHQSERLPEVDLRHFANVSHDLGMLANELQENDVARSAFADGAAAFDDVATRLNLSVPGRLQWAECHAFLAGHQKNAGEIDAAVKSFSIAVKLLRPFADASNAPPRLKDRYRKCLSALEELKATESAR